jgi:hypothetical protein
MSAVPEIAEGLARYRFQQLVAALIASGIRFNDDGWRS